MPYGLRGLLGAGLILVQRDLHAGVRQELLADGDDGKDEQRTTEACGGTLTPDLCPLSAGTRPAWKPLSQTALTTAFRFPDDMKNAVDNLTPVPRGDKGKVPANSVCNPDISVQGRLQ